MQTLRVDEGTRSGVTKVLANESDLDTHSSKSDWNRSWGDGEGDFGHAELGQGTTRDWSCIALTGKSVSLEHHLRRYTNSCRDPLGHAASTVGCNVLSRGQRRELIGTEI